MRSQIEKNKETLHHELQKLCGVPVSFETAQKIITCHKAYEIIERISGNSYAHGADIQHKLSETDAKNWTSSMENADGTHGAHWTMDKTEEVRKQFCINSDPVKWWVTMNMMYSDYCTVAEKLGVSNLEFYACMSKAFLNDKDAQSDKLSRYYEFIVGHDHG